uniref:(California timema) hypothetical protein n=1 Tax=Timema californicum TaxID=61474 RepID=A0A7R9JCE9_TIMCA|nr:unnamed protein product [Timema californicum]
MVSQDSRSVGVRNSPDTRNIRGRQDEKRSSSKTISHELTYEYESMSNRKPGPSITDDNTATSPPRGAF